MNLAAFSQVPSLTSLQQARQLRLLPAEGLETADTLAARIENLPFKQWKRLAQAVRREQSFARDIEISRLGSKALALTTLAAGAGAYLGVAGSVEVAIGSTMLGMLSYVYSTGICQREASIELARRICQKAYQQLPTETLRALSEQKERYPLTAEIAEAELGKRGALAPSAADILRQPLLVGNQAAGGEAL